MTEIVSGIHQLKVPIPNNPLENTNVYLISSNKGHTLIDAGWNSEEAFISLSNQMSESAIRFQDISQILVTHVHHDHYGLAGRLREISGAKITLHRHDHEFLSSHKTKR